MMKEIRVAALAAVLAVASTMAQAQSRADWAGWYAGAFLGWTQGETKWAQGALTTPNFDTSGLVAGAFGGYNWQSNKLVYGIDAEFGLGEVDGTFFPFPCGGTGCTTELNQFATLRARLGTEVGNALIYGALGAAWGTFKLTLGAIPPVTDDSFGWTGAIGYELPLQNNWRLRTEVSVMDFGSLDFGPIPGLKADADMFTTIKVGLARPF